jgi:hypothetical protein
MTWEVIAFGLGWHQLLGAARRQRRRPSIEEPTMNTIVPSLWLKRAFWADAAVCGITAALQLAATGVLTVETGLPGELLTGTGLFLVGYVALLLTLATRTRLWSGWVWLVVVGNLAWGVGAVEVSLTLQLSALGEAFALVQAVAVAAFAALEYRGLRLSERADGEHSGLASV